MVLVLGIVKASLEILGIGIGVKKVVLLMSARYSDLYLRQQKFLFFFFVNGYFFFITNTNYLVGKL